METSVSYYQEDDLIRHLKRGSKKAFAYLYDHYGAAIHKTILTIVDNEHTAASVLHDAFVVYFMDIELYDKSKSRFFTWMLNTARNKAYTALNAMKVIHNFPADKIQSIY